MKKVFLVLIVIFIAVLLFYYTSRSFTDDNLAKHLDSWDVHIGGAGFALTDFFKSSSGGLGKETLEAQREDMMLRMTKIKTEAPQKYIEDKKFLLESLFLPTTSPYPEVITNVIDCPEEFRPKVQEVGQGTIYTLFAGERFTYGICAKDLVAYYSAYGIFNCKEKGIFEVRAFSKTRGEEETTVQSFSCA